jgi:hypothetical protein
MGDRLPAGTDLARLAEFVLTVMEGAIMQSRTHRDIGPFDRNVAVLREHFDILEQSSCRQRTLAERQGGETWT